MAKSTVVRTVVAIAVAVVTLLGSATAASAAARPEITSVTFSGLAGSGMPSPTVTVHGSLFGTQPTSTANNVTSCGTYTQNGRVFKGRFYFVGSGNFEAGYSNASGADCIGLAVSSWTATQIVFKFGHAYGSFAHWYLSNGDGFALSVKTTLWGGSVSGLT
jgi:hypothetical protein